MKRLSLIRHAKSSWKQREIPDFERPLNARGERDAPEMALRFARRSPPPDAILSSPAARAASTARAVARALGRDEDGISYERQLYLASATELLTLVQRLDDELEHVAIVGHNPGISALADALAREAVDSVPTSGVVRLELDVERWREVGEGRGHVVEVDLPRHHRR
jgi:phosphohistidine phosphatase